MSNSLSRSGFKEFVRQVTSDAKTKFGISGSISYKEKKYEDDEVFFHYDLLDLNVGCAMGKSYGHERLPYLVSVTSERDEVDAAAIYIVERLKSCPVIRTTLEVHNPANVKLVAAKDKEVIANLKELVREKEVIIKIRCPYCDNIYDETLDKCPHCGAKR